MARKKRSPIAQVFRTLWRLIVAAYVVVTILLALIVPVVLYFTFFGGDQVTVEEDTALVWAPRGNLIEQRRDGLPDFMGPLVGRRDPETVVYDLVEALDRAADDPRIELAFLKLDEMGAAMPGQLEELTAAIDRFKRSGKQVVAWSPTYNQAQYRLAAHADKIYLDPMGYVFLEGYGHFRLYFGEALDKLGVRMHVFRVGEYKSFVEPFTRNDMSPQAEAAARVWLESIWQTYKAGVAAPNAYPPEAIDAYIDNFDTALAVKDGNAARVALNAALVDELATVEAMRSDMREIVGTDSAHGSFRQIHHADYLRATASDDGPVEPDATVGVVVVEGPIVEGESIRGAAGGETVSRLIERVRRDDNAKALVLRVQSPGGSAFASERIRREVELTREAGKPVVVSMAGVAASGGYWISMNADRIWVHPSTVTGSIGVFGIVPTFSEPLADLGIYTDGVGTTPLAGAFNLTQPLAPRVERILQAGVEHIYRDFIRKVARARDMDLDAVRRIAQGRVWSGLDARRIGLVDDIGGLEAAVASAAKLAELEPDDYRLEFVRMRSDWRALLTQFFSVRADLPLVPDWLSRLTEDPGFDWLLHGLNDPRGIYAHCFCELAPSDARP